jgi:hypothetical protein
MFLEILSRIGYVLLYSTFLHVFFLLLCFLTLYFEKDIGTFPLHNFSICTLHLPNIAVEWLALLFHIQEVQCSNLGLETTYPEFFMFFSHYFQENVRIVP